MKKHLLFSFIGLLLLPVWGQEISYKTLKDLPYYEEPARVSDPYIAERCKLDLYYPEGKDAYATVVWFHGGGLKYGDKEFPKGLLEQGIAIVAVNYRFYPKIKAPAYIEDAAASVAWTFTHISEYGGDEKKIFVSGHSAGGYLASMIGLDKRWLAKHKIDADSIAGLIPFSGHTITHFTVREERGMEGTQPLIDELAPLFHVRADAPPLLLITGDRELELLGRYEENAYMMRMMRVVGHSETRLLELDGYGHSMVEPAIPLLLNEVKRVLSHSGERED